MEPLVIGVIVNTHGLRGELKIKPLTHFIAERFAKKQTVYMKENNQEKSLVVQNVRENKGMLLVSFEGYSNINDVEAWKGNTLYIHEDDLHELEEDEIYFFELRDCKVESLEGETLGVVSEIIETGANVVIRVKNEAGKEILIPYVKAFIKEVDKENKLIKVQMMDGLV